MKVHLHIKYPIIVDVNYHFFPKNSHLFQRRTHFYPRRLYSFLDRIPNAPTFILSDKKETFVYKNKTDYKYYSHIS